MNPNKKQKRPGPPRKHRPDREKPGVKALLAQPPATMYRMPELELRGGFVLTDGCRRVLDFSEKKISLDLGNRVITLYGAGLRIESYAGKRLVAAGRITRIDLKQKWGDADD